MNLTISVDSKALDASLAHAPAVIRDKASRWINTTALMTEIAAKESLQPNVDTGQTLNSIHTVIGTLQAQVMPTSKQAPYIIKGRLPGKMPPFGEGTPLNRWATKRGMVPFLVARSIGAKGIKANPFMDKAYNIVKPKAERSAQALLSEIVSAL